ncbi:hypothetical protein [Almyronema epifaneia]|uniref:Uncharacterized protein n=1 Tax=Almyronema epifaneia S1 TaxID=2991925 RepID=A0ABW6IHK8_9CYAN
MTGFTTSGFSQNQQTPSVRQRFWRVIKGFWAFSHFYGEYQSLAPHQRRQHLAQLEADSRRLLK